MIYKRVLLKLSGEALKAGNNEDVLDSKYLHDFASIVKELVANDIEVTIIVGGGNIWRGRVSKDFNLDHENADYMGMLATNINALVIQNVLGVDGIDSVVFSQLPTGKILPKYRVNKAKNALKKKRVVIVGGGTGKPFCSTDTAAALIAKDIKAEVILSGKNGVIGVYDQDPKKGTNKDAKLLRDTTYDFVIQESLKALDLDCVKICKDNDIIIRVFNINDLKNIIKVMNGDNMGTTIRKE